MNKLALFLTVPLMFSLSNTALAATERERDQSSFTLLGGLIQLSDRKLSEDLSGPCGALSIQRVTRDAARCRL